MITKTEVDYEFYDIADIIRDCSDIILQIKASKTKLIFIGSQSRLEYNYDILMDILVSNLESDIDFYIYESPLGNIPYGSKADIVTPTTVPELLKSLNEMSSIAEYSDVTFIGLDITNLGSVSISEKEYKAVLSDVLQENNISSVVVKVNGVVLRKEIGLGGIFMHN